MNDMKSCVVTGATSMIGIATIKECIANGIKVLAIFRENSSRRDALPDSDLIECIECDLSELELINCDDKYDVFYHFGWGFTDRTTRDNASLQLNNIKYTLDAVELAYRLGCKKFVCSGSQAEYGFQNIKLTEDTAVKPESCYGICKHSAGLLARKKCQEYGIICIWTRIFSVYGTNDSPNTLIKSAINKYRLGEVIELSDCKQLWNYLYEDDAGVYMYLIGDKVTDSEIINVAGCETKPLFEYIDEMKEVFGETFRVYMNPEKKANGINPDTTKLVNLTGYKPSVGFKEGVKIINSCFQ